MFTEYKALAPTFSNYPARIELLRALVAAHLATPSALRLIGGI